MHSCIFFSPNFSSGYAAESRIKQEKEVERARLKIDSYLKESVDLKESIAIATGEIERLQRRKEELLLLLREKDGRDIS